MQESRRQDVTETNAASARSERAEKILAKIVLASEGVRKDREKRNAQINAAFDAAGRVNKMFRSP